MSDSARVSRRESLTEIAIDRPDKRNAIDGAMLDVIEAAVRDFADDPAQRVFLLRAEGPYFSAGGDLESDVAPDMDDESPARFRRWIDEGAHSIARITQMIDRIEKPFVVAHQGPCFGGALELSLAFDFRLAGASAYYALPEIRFGVVSIGGGPARLARLVGAHWARWIALAGQKVDAAKAESIGLIHACHPDADLAAAVDRLCADLATIPPEAYAANKAVIALASELGASAALDIGRVAASGLVFGAEFRDAFAAARGRISRKD